MIEAVIDVIMIGLLSLIFYHTFSIVQRKAFTPLVTLGIGESWLYGAMFLWTALTIIEMIAQLVNIVKNGEPIIRFEGEKLKTLLSIRRGEWTFDEIMAHAEKIQAAIESGKGRLPLDCDRSKADELIAAVMERAGVS